MNTSVYVKNASKNFENQHLKKVVEKISTALKSKESADAIIAFNAYAIQKNELFKLDGFKDYSSFCKATFGWNKSTACNYAKIGRLFTEMTFTKSGAESIRWIIDGFNKTAWIQFSRLFDEELTERLRFKSVDDLQAFINEKTLYGVPVDRIKKAIDKYIHPDDDESDDTESGDSESDDSESGDAESGDSESGDAFNTAYLGLKDDIKYASGLFRPDDENQKLFVSMMEKLEIMLKTR